ncbi:hypothetical protein K1719_012766 [Acacia pycnantha]|nr:hypothetical protein K1719_012766 [Acacia pycnantha]
MIRWMNRIFLANHLSYGHNGAKASEMASKLLVEYFVLHTYFLLDATYSFLYRHLQEECLIREIMMKRGIYTSGKRFLVGMNCILEGRLCFAFPKEVEQLVERKILLKIKLNRYDNDHPNSSVLVSRYVECADLNDDFNEFASVVQAGGPSALAIEEDKDIVYVKNATVEAMSPGGTEAVVTVVDNSLYVELEEVSISHKKPVGENSNSRVVVPSSPSKTYAKPNKSIKQEKMGKLWWTF